MATVKSVTQVKDIVLSDKERKYIVVSAPGKRFSGDTKVTDLLYAAYAEQKEKGNAAETLKEIKDRFVKLSAELGVSHDWDAEFEKIAEGIAASSTADYAASRGEYLSAVLTAKVLGFEFIDSADIIKFRSDGTFDALLTNDLVKKRCMGNPDGIVIPGFSNKSRPLPAAVPISRALSSRAA